MDGGWVKILEQKTWVFFALAVFFGGSSWLLHQGLMSDLKASYPWSKDGSLAASLLFSSLAIISSTRGIGSWITQTLRLRKARHGSLARLKHLTQIEHQILSYLVQLKQRSFNCSIINGDVGLLIQKRLVIRAGGTHNTTAWPHLIPDHIWHFLLENQDDFNSADLNAPPPWVRHWMAQ